MSTRTLPGATSPGATRGTWAADGWTVTRRNLVKLRRSPDLLVFAVLQPVMFVLLFSQVYGGPIRVAGTDYTQYLRAGIFGQTVLVGSTFSGAGMAQDLKEGIVDRFRTLPVSPSAVLMERTNSDLVLDALSMVIMIGTGFVVGWRFTTSVGSFLAGVALLLLSSSAFVRSQNLPGPLETFANWNSVSALVQAARELFGNTGSAPVPDVWPMQHPVLTVVAGRVLLVGVFVPLCLRKFATVSSR